MGRVNHYQPRIIWDRFRLLAFFTLALFVVITGKLAWLQIVHGTEYRELADAQNSRGVILPAKRGDIYAKDYRTADLFPLAQNSTTYTIFADPMLLANETGVADLLAPLLYVPPEESESADKTTATVPAVTPPETATDNLKTEAKNQTAVETEKLPLVDPRLAFKSNLLEKLLTKSVVRREIGPFEPEELKLATDSHLPGISVNGDRIIINPTLIEEPEDTARKLAAIVNSKYTEIYPLLLRKKIRYAKLAGNLPATVKSKILALGIRGIGALPEYRRIYPEKNLAAQVVGFLNHDEVGAYGIEGSQNKLLAGKNGLRRTQVDPFNRQITVGDITIHEATDGTKIVLTIDRAIQELVEGELKKAVESQRADSGQVIIMNPATGAILALAHYPNFDPNDYGAVYEKEEVRNEDIVTEWEHEYVVHSGYRFPIFKEKQPDGSLKNVIYKNRLGEGVFALRGLTDPYEPGSVFKPIVMAMALDSGEVTPTTRSPYTGPVQLNERLANGKPVIIKNAEQYFGHETMTEVIEHSSNIGMTFVAQRLGRATFYDYLKKFSFGERTDIELDGEAPGYFENYTKWSESELVTKAFGQGISVNLLQMATAYSALANGGLLMKPYIIDTEILPDGRRIITEPETVRRVISKEASAQITAILISSVQRGYAKRANISGYFVAGKTGTSQTYSRSGEALFGIGTTIAGFGGFAPATDPKFVMIAKVDRPRVSEWGEASAGVIFKAVAEELLKNYFAIPPTKQ